jgi:hypothetical protein
MLIKQLTVIPNVEVCMIDNCLGFTPEDIGQLTDGQLIVLLRWWEKNGEGIYREEHDRHNRGELLDWPRPGVVYLMRRSDGLVKIGFTTRPKERYEKLREQQGERLELLHEIKAENPYDLEQRLHREFSAFNVEHEWFLFPPSVLQEIISR